MTEKTLEKATFASLGLSENVLKRLETLKFIHPTPIQTKAIPSVMKGKDVIGIAQTGTGKTLAFSIPIIETLLKKKGKGLILLPTRELAVQVEEELAKVGRPFGIHSVVLIGGASMYLQTKKLRQRPNVIIATPGRLIDHMEQKNVSLNDVNILVLDEADRMLDMGFEPQMKKILAVVPKKRQTMLFSATMPEEIAKLARTYMDTPVRVEVAKAGTAAAKIVQEAFIVSKNDKLRLLALLLSQAKGPTLVFSRTKHGAKKMTTVLHGIGFKVAEIHSNRSQNQRQEALRGFKSGKYQFLVATDIAARGIDVTGIESVINYDLPDQLEDYVHRIGRTGRAGLAGRAVSFVEPNQRRDLQKMERLARSPIKLLQLPVLPQLPAQKYVQQEEPKRHGFKRPFGGGGRPHGRPYARSGASHSGARSSGGRPSAGRPSGGRPSGRPGFGSKSRPSRGRAPRKFVSHF